MEPRIIQINTEYPHREQLTGLGELCFLFMRARNFQTRSVDTLRAALEPAVDTGHFALMRQDGVPRAAVTWAFFDEETEERMLAGERMSSHDWISGDRLWLMEIVAPYGQGSGRRMVRYFEEQLKPSVTEYRASRASRHAGTARVYLCRRLPSGRFGSVVREVSAPGGTAMPRSDLNDTVQRPGTP